MDFALQPHLYRHVPVLYWPFLFWQLWRIALWGEATGRDLMIGVDRSGRVHITAIGDDPAHWSPNAYPHLHEHYLTPRLSGEDREHWRARLAAIYAPGFGLRHWIFWRRVLGALAAQSCRFERANIRDPVVV